MNKVINEVVEDDSLYISLSEYVKILQSILDKHPEASIDVAYTIVADREETEQERLNRLAEEKLKVQSSLAWHKEQVEMYKNRLEGME